MPQAFLVRILNTRENLGDMFLVANTVMGSVLQ